MPAGPVLRHGAPALRRPGHRGHPGQPGHPGYLGHPEHPGHPGFRRSGKGMIRLDGVLHRTWCAGSACMGGTICPGRRRSRRCGRKAWCCRTRRRMKG
ncbi:MAG: hypothetical protein D8H96_16655 [Lautropia sp.]|nr:MAG: hypothetical protein D8H96_16655 [Lautropia sp.]